MAPAVRSRMTADEYYATQSEIFAANNTPHEFQGVMSSQAWDRGHSSGYEECINILRELAREFRQPILEFSARLRREH